MGLARSSRVSNFGNINTLKKVHGFKRFHLSPWILFFKITVIVLIFFAATNTLVILKQKPALDTDYVIVLDDSSSMANTDYPPSRLDAAKDIAQSWLKLVPESTNVGYVAFAQDLIKNIPLTSDKSLVKDEIKSTKIDYSQSGTSTDYALISAIKMLELSPSTNKSILFLTDGVSSLNEETIAFANKNNVHINVFGIGSSDLMDLNEIPEEFRDDYIDMQFNFTVLEDLANKTKGSAYLIFNQEELEDSFEDATFEKVNMKLNSGYYILILVAIISITELFVFSKVGGI